jgi:hypothetical protein
MKQKQIFWFVVVFLTATFANKITTVSDSGNTKFSHDFKVKVKAGNKDTEKIKLKDSPTSTVLIKDILVDLYELANGYDIELTYTITNESSTSKTIDTGDTPLEEFADKDDSVKNIVKTNFFAGHKNVFHDGVITDQAGEFLHKKTLGPQDSLSKTWSLKNNTLFSPTQDVSGNLTIDFQLKFELNLPTHPDQTNRSLDLDAHPVKTDSIQKYIEPSKRRNLEPRRSLMMKNDGVPRIVFECIEDTLKHSEGTLKCTRLNPSANLCSQEWAWSQCPVSCGKCEEMEKRETKNWTNPKEDRIISFVGCSKKQRSKNVDAERVKKKQCRNVLYQLKRMKDDLNSYTNIKVLGIFKRWFGYNKRDLLANRNRKFEVFFQGFVKICSADNYEFNCTPDKWKHQYQCEIGAKGPSKYAGQAYKNITQRDLIHNEGHTCEDKENWLNNPSIYGFGGTVAYVINTDTKLKTINNCRLMLWKFEDDELYQTRRDEVHDTIPSIIVHELTHFVDVCDTADLDYEPISMKRKVKSAKGSMDTNAQSWAYFFIDKDWPTISDNDWSDWPPTEFEKTANDTSDSVKDSLIKYFKATVTDDQKKCDPGAQNNPGSPRTASKFKTINALVALFAVLIFFNI